MKVGDLVIKRSSRFRVSPRLLGIILEKTYYRNTPITYMQVCWGSYGTFWGPSADLEVISESR